MTEADVRTFLKRFAAEDLAAKGVLNGKTLLLNNKSVTPLTELMHEHGLSRLVAAARDWSSWILSTQTAGRRPPRRWVSHRIPATSPRTTPPNRPQRSLRTNSTTSARLAVSTRP